MLLKIAVVSRVMRKNVCRLGLNEVGGSMRGSPPRGAKAVLLPQGRASCEKHGKTKQADGQWPPLRVQPCRFRQKYRISTSSAQCAHWAPSPPGEGLRMRSSSSHYGFLTVSSPGRHDCRDLILFYEHLPFGMGVILLRCKPYYSIRSPSLTQPRRRQARSSAG